MKIIKNIFIFLITVFILVLYLFIKMDTHVSEVTFISCVDGDTAVFEIEGNEEKVRFLAIDTMELNHKLGIEASDYVCKVLNNASKIELEFDGETYRDKYNRVLAWVFVDGRLLQEELVSKGLAKVKYVYDDYKYVDRLFDLQDKSKMEKVGLWSEDYE